MPLLSIPPLPVTSINREFIIDDVKFDITSVDIASHGGFVIVGCSNGVILFFDLTEDPASQRNGIFLAHIRAKGMHTSFRLNVKIAEDSRMCFAGVLKGSSEMIAVDLSAYQLNWNKISSSSLKGNNNKNNLNNSTTSRASSPATTIFDAHQISAGFKYFNYSDAKLRGFGAAIFLPDEKINSETRKYFLACGMGIKNIHVWQVLIRDDLANVGGSSSPSNEDFKPPKIDEWSCIYDVASNGMTITHLGFRNDGKELLTKSHGMNIRVWDLSKYEEEPGAKPAYEDIANSFDVKCLLENTTFTYGGIYEFAVVNVDKNIPKEANRNVLELPGMNSTETDDPNLRRRRTLREVQEVIGTQDGKHVLLLSSDGGVLYYKHPDENTKPNDDPVKIEELAGIQRDVEHDQGWFLRRIGGQGLVVLLRAYYKLDKVPKPEPVPAGTIPPMSNSVTQPSPTGVSAISIVTLSDILPRGSALKTQLMNDMNPLWHRNGMYYQQDIPTNLLTTPSIIPGFRSNPSTDASTSTPYGSFMMSSDTPNTGMSSDRKVGGIALSSPESDDILKSVKSTNKELPRAGLPPTSKKRKGCAAETKETWGLGLETPLQSASKKVAKTSFTKTPSSDILSTPMASNNSEEMPRSSSKKSLETKLFSTSEKASPGKDNQIMEIEDVNNEEITNNDVEEEQDESILRLVNDDNQKLTEKSPVRISQRLKSVQTKSQERMHDSPSAAQLLPLEEPVRVLRIKPAPRVKRIALSEDIIPIKMEEISEHQRIRENAFKILLEKWEAEVLQNKFPGNGTSTIPKCFPIPSLLPFLMQEMEREDYSEHEEKLAEAEFQEIKEEILEYEKQLNLLNERFYQEQKNFQYLFHKEMSKFFNHYKRDLLSKGSTSSLLKEDFEKIQQEFLGLINCYEKLITEDILERQKLELKGFYTQLLISVKNEKMQKLIVFYQQKVLMISFVFQSIIEITRQFMKDVMIVL